MSYALFGVPIEGLERDMAFELNLGGQWIEPVGACPRWVRHSPIDGSLDCLDGDVTIWCHGQTAAALEASCPPHGDGDATWALPTILSEIAIPGISGSVAGELSTISNVLMRATIESLGRKGPGLDLFGYHLTYRIPCDTTNSGFSTATPPIIARKFGAHQLQLHDAQIMGSISTLGARSWAQGYARQHGKRVDANVDIDHADYIEADGLVRWLRAVRGDAVAFPSYGFGPTYATETVMAVIRKATFSRSNGLFWSVRLEASLANSTSTTPIISGITPAFIAAGVSANIIITGTGFDATTTVTVGGTTCTVTGWTSGRLDVTVPAGVSGQYEVVVANVSGSSTGTLWRYDAGEITIGTGGTIVATTAVAINKNQLVGLNASGDAVLADAVLGIVAVGFSNADAAVGAAVQINQTGHATPVGGLTDGQPVYLGAAGSYVTAPPTGATISQQVGVGTATGVAVNPQQAVYL